MGMFTLRGSVRSRSDRSSTPAVVMSLLTPRQPCRAPFAKGISGTRRACRRMPRLESLEDRRLLSTLSGYTFTSIDVPGASSTVAAGINDSGEISGQVIGNSGLEQGFLRDNQGNYTFFAFGAVGINDLGQTVGSEVGATSEIPDGYIRDASGSFTVFDVPGASNTSAAGINDLGQVVGFYNRGGAYEAGFLRDSGGGITTIDVPGAYWTSALGINNSGQIVGEYGNAIGYYGYYGFLLSGGVYTTINFPGAAITSLVGINNSGQSAGYYLDASGQRHGFLLSGGTYTTVDVPFTGATGTVAYGINDAGQIVGVYYDANGHNHGFLASPATVLAATPPSWNTTNGGVDYGYTIGSAGLPQATTVDLDWASGTTVNTVIGSPIVSTTTATAQGTYQLHATPSQLGTPPAGATYLLVVADPDNLVSPADPSKVASLALSSLVVTSQPPNIVGLDAIPFVK